VVLSGGRLVDEGPPQRVLGSRDLERWGLEQTFRARLADALRGLCPRLGPAADGAGLAKAVAACARRSGVDRDARPPAAPEDGGDTVDIRGLRHIYLRGTPLEHTALSGVDFALGGDGNGVLIGATGSGKSTVLQHLNGLLRPHAGSVRVLGEDTASPGTDLARLRRKVGLVFQRPEDQIFERYTGDEIAFGPRQAGLKGPQLRERVRWAMERVGLDFEALKDRPAHALSGGERRRVGLAGVLALQPALLALDEPTSGLDPVGRRRILDLLADLRAGGTRLVLATHSMEDAAELGDRLLVLDHGRSVLSGDAAQVFGERERLAAWGLAVPTTLAFVDELREQGLELPAARSGRWADLLAALADVLREGEGGRP
jgi:energy-coupling factor transport system ATP-binding protein